MRNLTRIGDGTMWTALIYKDHVIKTQICTSYACAKARALDITSRHNTPVEKITRDMDIVRLDLGGMLKIDSPRVIVKLSKSRTIEFWKHQASDVYRYLARAQTRVLNGKTYFALPGAYSVTFFFSTRDRDLILKALSKEKDTEYEKEYKDSTFNALVKANAKATGHSESTVRKELIRFRERREQEAHEKATK